MVGTEALIEGLQTRFVCLHRRRPQIFEKADVIPVILGALAPFVEVLRQWVFVCRSKGSLALPECGCQSGRHGRELLDLRGTLVDARPRCPQIG